MSKLFFLSTNLFTNPYPVYPLGMSVVSSALVAKGHEVRQYDLMAEDKDEDRLKKAIVDFMPDYVLLSLRNIDNVDSLTPESGWTLDKDKILLEKIRRIKKVPIIIGGSAFSAMPKEILEYVGADYGVIGEGEQVICKLIEALERDESVPRIIDSHETPLVGEDMCSALWDGKLTDYYLAQSGMLNLQTKRGCPHRCLYCVYPALEGQRFRVRDPKAVVEDITRLQRDYHVNTLFFTDSVFNDAAGHYLAVAEEIISAGLNIQWAGYFRPKGINLNEMKILKRSGLYAMEVGTDGGCDQTLDALKKGFHFDEVLAFNADCIRAEIPSAHFFMFGGPEETDATVTESLKNIHTLKKCAVMVYSGIRILPGAGLYTKAIQDNIITEQTALLKPVYYFSPHVDVSAMNQAIEKAFEGHRECIFPPVKGQRLVSAMRAFGFKGLLWDRLISFTDNRREQRKKRT